MQAWTKVLGQARVSHRVLGFIQKWGRHRSIVHGFEHWRFVTKVTFPIWRGHAITVCVQVWGGHAAARSLQSVHMARNVLLQWCSLHRMGGSSNNLLQAVSAQWAHTRCWYALSRWRMLVDAWKSQGSSKRAVVFWQHKIIASAYYCWCCWVRGNTLEKLREQAYVRRHHRQVREGFSSFQRAWLAKLTGTGTGNSTGLSAFSGGIRMSCEMQEEDSRQVSHLSWSSVLDTLHQNSQLQPSQGSEREVPGRHIKSSPTREGPSMRIKSSFMPHSMSHRDQGIVRVGAARSLQLGWDQAFEIASRLPSVKEVKPPTRALSRSSAPSVSSRDTTTATGALAALGIFVTPLKQADKYDSRKVRKASLTERTRGLLPQPLPSPLPSPTMEVNSRTNLSQTVPKQMGLHAASPWRPETPPPRYQGNIMAVSPWRPGTPPTRRIQKAKFKVHRGTEWRIKQSDSIQCEHKAQNRSDKGPHWRADGIENEHPGVLQKEIRRKEELPTF